MFDLYALPGDFPGAQEALVIRDPYKKVKFLEKRLSEDINHQGFIPYIQLFEFEALLFSDLDKFALEYLEHDKVIERLKQTLQQSFQNNPELIDDGPNTAPSKRILTAIPEYSKSGSGVIIAKMIGLERIRSMCRHFNDWICKLEGLVD